MSKPRLKKGMQFLTYGFTLMHVEQINFSKHCPIRASAFVGNGEWSKSYVCYNLAGEPNFNQNIHPQYFKNFKAVKIVNPPQELEK